MPTIFNQLKTLFDGVSGPQARLINGRRLESISAGNDVSLTLNRILCELYQAAVVELVANDEKWIVNNPEDGRIWLMKDGVFISMQNALNDIAGRLSEPNIFRYVNRDVIADILLSQNLTESVYGKSMCLFKPSTWLSLNERPRGADSPYAIKIKDPSWLPISTWPDPVEGEIHPPKNWGKSSSHRLGSMKNSIVF